MQDPDGVPHYIVGLTLVLALVSGIASIAVLASGRPSVLVMLGGLIMPTLVVALATRSTHARER